MLERSIQAYLVKESEKLGYLAMKVESTSRRGFPDIILFKPGGEVRLIEVKQKNGKLSMHQVSLHGTIIQLGTPVYVVSSKAEVDELLHG